MISGGKSGALDIATGLRSHAGCCYCILPFNCCGLGIQEGTAFFPNSSLAGNGLLVSDGAVWRRQRQLSNPAFRTAAVQAYAQVRGEGSARLCTHLGFGRLQARRTEIGDITRPRQSGKADDRCRAEESRTCLAIYAFIARLQLCTFPDGVAGAGKRLWQRFDRICQVQDPRGSTA